VVTGAAGLRNRAVRPAVQLDMSPAAMLSRRAALMAIAVAVALTGGCRNHAGSWQVGGPSQSPSAPVDRKAAAQRDVADRLATFRPPGDAKPLPGPPRDAKVLTDVISKSSGNTWVMQFMHPVPGIVAKSASSNDYAPGFMTDLMAKDLGLAVNAARELRVPVVVAPAAQQVLRLASSHGLGRRDFTSVYVFLKPSAGEAPV